VAATTDRPGEFADLSGNRLDFSVPVMRRALASSVETEEEGKKTRSRRGPCSAGTWRPWAGRWGEQFFSPEWISAANDHLSRMAGRNPDDILASFRNKVFAETGKDMGDGS
jgi:hypothetical protein